MRRNPLWLLFLAIIGLGTLGYTGYAGFKVWNYSRLDRQTAVQDIHWTVTMHSDEAFIPHARYHFTVKGKIYEGQTLWKETYLNEWTAQEAIKRIQEPITVWYDESSPEHSTLEKVFPFKESFSAVSLWIICLYFVCLDTYVRFKN